MKKLFEDVVRKIQFEQLMGFCILAILAIAMFIFGGDKETLNLILGAFIGYFTNNITQKFKSNKEEKE